MSLLRIIKERVPVEQVVLGTSHSKMVSSEDFVSGNIVTKYEFGVADFKSDMRNDINIYDLSLSNIRRLGRLNDLKEVTLLRNDVDLVIDSLNAMQNESAEASAETAQKG